MKAPKGLLAPVSALLHGRSPLRAFDGPLTEQLVREPGLFGLGQVPRSVAPDATTSSVCGFCSTGCSLKVHLRDGRAVNLTPDPDYPVNIGMACPKGWEALTPLAASDRLTTPMYRESRDDELREISWEQAARIFCHRMRKVADEHSLEACAYLSTGQICTEEMAFLGAFAKFGMGMVHGDGNTRQCMATAATAYKQSFGFDAPPFTYADFEESDVIVLIGANLCIAHPIMWQRVLQNPHQPEIIVIDPRKTETAMQATRHAPLRPKSDLALLYGLANCLLENDWIDHDFIDAHTTDFADFAEHVATFDLDRVSQATGLPDAEITAIARAIGTGKRVSLWWTMGVNQGYEATRTAQAIINLALMTGNIGRPGTGANSITGQCNAMGSRLFSNTTNLLGGRSFTDEVDRREVAEILGAPVASIPDQPSWAYDEILSGIDSDDIRALWVIATNGAHSWCNQQAFERRMEKLDFLVVQDMYSTTETAQHADLLLPAAGWGEKHGTFINSERRIGVVKKVSPAPGQALGDFSIFRLLAEAWGGLDWLDEWKSPESAFQILKKLSRGRPCDITGIADYATLERQGGIQWPATTSEPEQQRRLFCDGKFYTPDQRARFLFDPLQKAPELVDAEYPFVMLTGRGSSAQWHTQTRTSKSAVLRRLYPQHNYAEIHPDDADEHGIVADARVRISSRRGSIVVNASLTSTVGRGQIFVPMHYADTNRLTLDAVDPHSRQPSYKYSAVKIESAKR